jgi:RNA polymerase sigma factor (sigma-70 family)
MATDPSKTGTTLLDWLRNPANSEAWGKFAERYHQKILDCCLRNGLQPADAEDIAQELLLKIRDKIMGFDLRVMSWGDGTEVPTSGNKLVIVGTDANNRLHIRIFDQKGNRVTDTDETQLAPAQAQAVLAVKRQLPGLLPPGVMTDAEQAQVLKEVASVSGQAQIRKFEYHPAKGKFRHWLTTVTRNACMDFYNGDESQRYKPLLDDPPVREDLERTLDDQARTELLHIALEQVRTQVSPRDYAIFRRRVFDRIPAATVAQEQGMSVAAVDQAKYRVMTKLREIIEELGGDAADQPESGP